MWGRGLKCDGSAALQNPCRVAPCVGAWVEMSLQGQTDSLNAVAPCVGAWVEIQLPLSPQYHRQKVAPCVGAWVEISPNNAAIMSGKSRPLCGGVG